MTLLRKIKQSRSTLSKAESRIAKIILDEPETMVNITTAELARLAAVSDPMVSRFCRTMGCRSFPDFKVQLAKSLATKASFISEAVSPGDSASSYIEKRINANQAALEFIREKLNASDIEKSVELLKAANQIHIFGMGGSAAIAKDAQHKLFRLGIPTVAYEDHIMQRMAAAAATASTVILIFSFTGRTQAMIEIAEIARQSNAKIITITSPESPLATLANVSIPSGDELEDTTIYVPMTTRIVILTIIDILVTGLALSMSPAIDGTLIKIKHSLDTTRIAD